MKIFFKGYNLKSYLVIVVSAISLGISTALYKKSTAEIGPINTTFYYYIFGTLISFIVWFFFKSPEKIVIKNLIYPAYISLALFISILSFNIGVQNAKVSISSTIRAFSFIFSILIAMIFYKEQINTKQLIGIILATISMFFLAS